MDQRVSKDLMVDLETLSLSPEGVVLSAGLVLFDKDEVYDEAYIELCVLSQVAAGRLIDPRTVAWWKKENLLEFERLLFSEGGDLADLSNLIIRLVRLHDIRNVWSRGSIDWLILENLMGSSFPFKYWNQRDVRTLDSLGLKMKANGHNALGDAKNQVLYVQEVLRKCTYVPSA